MENVKMADEITDEEITRVLTALTAVRARLRAGRPPALPYCEPGPLSTQILDNCGLTFNLAALKTWPAYKEARDRYFGTTRAAYWFMHRIHPLLFPRRHSQLKRQWVKARTAMQAEFLNAVIEAGAASLDKGVAR